MKYLFEFNLKLFDCIILSLCINNPVYSFKKAKEEMARAEEKDNLTTQL